MEIPESARPKPGRELGGYVLGEKLGAGGMGVVYRAIDADGNEVALKLLHPHFAADPDARSRLRREVATLQRVRGVGVSRVLDAETELDDAFIVTELIDGVTLDESVRRDGVFAGQELADFTDDMYRALAAIHAAGVVHRDLKPSNVMVTDNGPVLIDFGIAHAADESRITQTGMVMGTPGYLAPEVLSGATSSPDSDWWAHAAVLLFAATGRPAFGRGALDVVLGRVTSGACDVDGLEPRLAGIFRRALATEPVARTAPAQFLAELEAYAAALDESENESESEEDQTGGRGDSVGERRTRLQRVLPFAGKSRDSGFADGSDGDREDGRATTVLAGDGTAVIGADDGRGTRVFEVDATAQLDAGDSRDDLGATEPRPPMITPGVAPDMIAAPSRKRGVDIDRLPESLAPGGSPTPTPLSQASPVRQSHPQTQVFPASEPGRADQPNAASPPLPVAPPRAGWPPASPPSPPVASQPNDPLAWPKPDSWPGVGPAPAPRVIPTAPGFGVAVAGLTIGLGVFYPTLAFAALALVILVSQSARLAGRAGERIWAEKGRGPSSIRLAVGWPWYLLRSSASTLVSWCFAAAAGLLVIAGVELVVAITMDQVVANFGTTAQRWPLYARCGAAAGLGVSSLVAWLGPFGARQSEGLARIARVVMPSATVRNIVSIILIGVAVGVIAMAIISAGIPNWMPFTVPR